MLVGITAALSRTNSICQVTRSEPEECPEATAETPAAAEEPGIRAAEAADLTITEHPSSKKPNGSVCQLCQQVYYKKTYNGNKKREFVSHLVKAHNYHHLRGHTVLIQCRRCKIEKGRWSFVVGEGVSAGKALHNRLNGNCFRRVTSSQKSAVHAWGIVVAGQPSHRSGKISWPIRS